MDKCALDYCERTMAEVLERPQLSQPESALSKLISTLPRKPYCKAYIGAPREILSKKLALAKPLIQLNHPGMTHWVCIRINAPIDEVQRRLRGQPQPQFIVTRSTEEGDLWDGQLCDLLYGLKDGVCMTQAGRDKPRHLLAAIEDGLRVALGAEEAQHDSLALNPACEQHQVHTPMSRLYGMTELVERIDMRASTRRAKRIPWVDKAGFNRNNQMFESVRRWAYNWVNQYRTKSDEKGFRAAVRAQAKKLNTFLHPLPLRDVALICRKVAAWTYTKYHGKRTDAQKQKQMIEDKLTPESYSLWKSALGIMGNLKRHGDNTAKRLQAFAMRKAGERQVDIAAALGVTQKTISKWLGPKPVYA